MPSKNQLSQPPKVFLSYPREKKAIATEIYNELVAQRVDVWYDKKDLEYGDDAELVIREKIKASIIVIILLSDETFEDDRFIHFEIDCALKRKQRNPPGSIYIIPARLADLASPYHDLDSLTPVDLFPLDRRKDRINKLIQRVQETINSKMSCQPDSSSTAVLKIRPATAPLKTDQIKWPRLSIGDFIDVELLVIELKSNTQHPFRKIFRSKADAFIKDRVDNFGESDSFAAQLEQLANALNVVLTSCDLAANERLTSWIVEDRAKQVVKNQTSTQLHKADGTDDFLRFRRKFRRGKGRFALNRYILGELYWRRRPPTAKLSRDLDLIMRKNLGSLSTS